MHGAWRRGKAWMLLEEEKEVAPARAWPAPSLSHFSSHCDYCDSHKPPSRLSTPTRGLGRGQADRLCCHCTG